MSKIGFGTYRITEHNPEHIAALKLALQDGIDLIDTSTNYMNGESERAIALAMHDLPSEITDSVKIVSKFGYIQGSLLEEVKSSESDYSELVKFADHVYHSIHPEFMKNELTKSLSRLNVDSIDCYLIHNPEYYLFDAMNRDVAKESALDEMFRRIYKVFVSLEGEVKSGRIKSYGISSNSFAKPVKDLEFLPYEDLVTLAKKAAKESGNEQHSFSTIELPINMLEREGLKAASWAKKNGLRILVNRPLNAELDGNMYRLAQYNEPSEYFHHLNEISDFCESINLNEVNNLILQLDENRHKYSWIGDYEAFLYGQIVPHIQKSLQKYEENDRIEIAKQLNQFLESYSKMVAFELGEATKKVLEKVDLLDECSAKLQECAIEFLLKYDDVDYVLVGMRKVGYVDEVTHINL